MFTAHCPCAALPVRRIARAPHCPCAALPVRLCLAVLSVMLALLLSPTAHAGTYIWQTTDASGTVTARSPVISGGFWYTYNDSPKPYSIGYSGSGGSAETGGYAGQISSSGTIRTVYTWQPSYAGEPAPPVVIEQTCEATYKCDFSSAGGASASDASCSDGLDDLPIKDAYGNEHSSGTHYRAVVPDSTGKIVVDLVGAQAHAPASSFTNCTVWYTINAYPVTINLTGTKKDSSGNQNILVGQGCTARVDGIPDALLNNTPHPAYNWSISDNTFQKWLSSTPAFPNANPPTAANPNASYFELGPGILTNPTAHWYWDCLPATETVTCSVQLTPPDGQGPAFTVQATAKVKVMSPTYACDPYEGVVFISPDGTKMQASPTSDMYGHGETWFCNVQTPPLFGTGGSCYFCQIVTPGRSHTYLSGTVSCTENGHIGLDTIFPYDAEPGDPYTGTGIHLGWPADNTRHRSGDSPATALYDETGTRGVATSVSVTEKFNTFLMYVPPGDDVWPVPLHEIDWNWNSSASEPSSGWADPDGYTVTHITGTASFRDFLHPLWTRVESTSVGSGW